MAGKDEEDETLINSNDDSDVNTLNNEKDSDTSKKEVSEEKSDKKLSVREALKDAFEKENEKADEEKTAKKPVVKKEVEQDKETEDKDIDASDEKNSEIEEEVKKAKPTDIKAPVGWTKEAKAKWATLPPEIQQSVAKREQEVSDGFKKYGEEVAKYKDLETVLSSRRDQIKQFGATEAQTVDRLFKWMEALAHQDKNFAYNQWVQLGKNFGLQLPEKDKPDNQNQNDNTNKEDEIPAPLKSFMDTVTGEVSTLKQQLQNQKAKEAETFISNWSKDKPHFPAVRQSMFVLLNSGLIPMKNGELDLDEAYNQAVYANPTTRELLRQQEQETADQKAVEARTKIEDKRKADLKKAKAAGSSISPRAPTSSNVNVNKKAPSNVSVRDSIRNAIREQSNS